VLYFFVILHSAIRNLHSAIKIGGDLMLWIMDGPAMHHVGCMAALNLTWFRAESHNLEYQIHLGGKTWPKPLRK
jgi:hypothetical protein